MCFRIFLGIKSPALNRKQLSVDYVRFGETDIRTDRDCQSVNIRVEYNS